ncbi:ribokinase [Arthrobacter oryzae]|uniref:Ribokinase n=1 Tax=Arthrobacter oryzae TaxID=409290 RepID=A0A3N0BRC0_9MICC|nr:ribokinase [Arthrobacter oryzae]RNL51573.1 ribokinase [Arthrobacter oryzae]
MTAAAPANAGPIVVVGSINVDQVIRVDRHPMPGETVVGHSITILPGGKGANQAVAAAQLGAAVSLVGAVGNDGQSGAAMKLLVRAGVDLSAVTTVEGSTGLALINVSGDGENSIVVVPGANAAMGEVAVQGAAELIRNASVVVLQGEIPATGIAAAARLAAGRILLNLAPVINVDRAVILQADPLVVNEHEAALVLELLEPEREAPAGDEALVARLRASGIRSVVLTRGAQGAICSDADGTFVIPAPRMQAVDTSGAGDAFVGALSTRLATGQPLHEAARFACRVGAFAVQGHGTQPSYPTAADVLPDVEA